MSDWAPRKLRALIGDPISGSRPAGGVDSQSEGVPSLGGENILSDGGVTFNELKRVPRAFYDSMPRGHLQPFDVLINKDGAQTGKVGIYTGEFDKACVNEHLFILRNRDGAVDQRFLYYLLLLPETQSAIARRITGSAQPGLNSGFVDAVEIGLPPESGLQRRIAEILSTGDEAIEGTEKLIAKHQQIKAGLMHDLFTRGLTSDGRLRPPHTEAPHLYKDSPLGPIPKEWKVAQAGSLFSIQLGKMLSKASKTGSAPAPYLANRNVQWERVEVAELEWMDFSAAERERFSLRERDILICEGGEVGRTALWHCEVEDCYYQKAIHRLRPLSSNVSPEFFMWYMQLAVTSLVLRKLASQTSIAHLTREKLALLPVPLPTRDEQDAVAHSLGLVSGSIGAEQQKLEKLTRQKRGLVHDLLSGKVEVSIPEADDHA